MIANLLILEGEVIPSKADQRITAIIGSRQTTAAFTSTAQTEIRGENVLKGRVVEDTGKAWEFLLFPEFRIGAARCNENSDERFTQIALRYLDKAKKQVIGACCA